jgi:hypothetical protein
VSLKLVFYHQSSRSMSSIFDRKIKKNCDLICFDLHLAKLRVEKKQGKRCLWAWGGLRDEGIDAIGGSGS